MDGLPSFDKDGTTLLSVLFLLPICLSSAVIFSFLCGSPKSKQKNWQEFYNHGNKIDIGESDRVGTPKPELEMDITPRNSKGSDNMCKDREKPPPTAVAPVEDKNVVDANNPQYETVAAMAFPEVFGEDKKKPDDVIHCAPRAPEIGGIIVQHDNPNYQTLAAFMDGNNVFGEDKKAVQENKEAAAAYFGEQATQKESELKNGQTENNANGVVVAPVPEKEDVNKKAVNLCPVPSVQRHSGSDKEKQKDKESKGLKDKETKGKNTKSSHSDSTSSGENKKPEKKEKKKKRKKENKEDQSSSNREKKDKKKKKKGLSKEGGKEKKRNLSKEKKKKHQTTTESADSSSDKDRKKNKGHKKRGPSKESKDKKGKKKEKKGIDLHFFKKKEEPKEKKHEELSEDTSQTVTSE